MSQLSAPLNWFGTYYRMIQQNIIDTENMFDLLKTESQVKDKPNALEMPFFQKGGCDVRFENVSFGYRAKDSVQAHNGGEKTKNNGKGGDDEGDNTSKNKVINNISFYAPAGSTVAIVGSTGSGKSTVLRLLFRFYEPENGKISVAGHDICEVTQSSLRANIGMVPQDTVLFNDTLKHNILYGKLKASEDEMRHVSASASLDGHVQRRFEQHYDTIVGERGLRLSGGEKQRVGLARTLLKNASLLILDEATSALDSLTEREVQMALKEASAGRTSIIVAHRLSTVVHADQILVSQNLWRELHVCTNIRLHHILTK